jgi:hypothetical protein
MIRIAASALLVGAAAQEATPVSKVIEMLSNMADEVKAEGASEAEVYDKFACWCRSTSTTRSDNIRLGRDAINTASAQIAADTSAKNNNAAELVKRKADEENMATKHAETTALLAKETELYEAQAADLNKAIASLNNAINRMEDAKVPPTALVSLRSTIERSVTLAEDMSLGSEKTRLAVRSFLQVDPSDPEYEFHSTGIVETMNQLLKEFSAEKTEVDSSWTKQRNNLNDSISDLEDKRRNNNVAIGNRVEDISALEGVIAATRVDLVHHQETLKEDQAFLQETTDRCESRARDWDQRSAMRKDELAAMEQALEVLRGTVKSMDSVNQRAMLMQMTSRSFARGGLKHISPHVEVPSFLQETVVSSDRNLRGASALSTKAQQERVVSMLREKGQTLGSKSLSLLANSLKDGPFDSVKTLIQQLVERLVQEATSEATKKGFCDEALGKAHQDRDYRNTDTVKLIAEIQGLKTKRDELGAEIAELTGGLESLEEEHSAVTEQRDNEHSENVEVLKKAKAGFNAIEDAINILKAFYKNAAKASFLQQVPEDRAGFEGSYKGKQGGSQAIIGLMQVIRSDFDRTIRNTEAAEKKSHEEYVKFDRAIQADTASKRTQKTLNEEDLEATKNKLVDKMKDLQSAQNLLDAALKTIEELKPACIDTGMSYEDRVAKRKQEIEALNDALDIFTPTL